MDNKTTKNMKIEYTNEVWKPIKGYEGLYEISNLGRIKSLNYHHTGREKILKPIKKRDGYLSVVLSKDGKKKQPYVHQLVAQAFLEPVEGKEFVDHINGVRDENWVELKEDSNGNLVVVNSNLRWCTNQENSGFPLARENNSKAHKIAMNRPEVKEKLSKVTKARWENPEHREKTTKAMKIALNRPEVKEKLSKVFTNRTDQSKPVLQFTKDGEFVAEYPSMGEASRQTGFDKSNICFCCTGKYKQAYGFIWCYAS